jgi:hypothetical protein
MDKPARVVINAPAILFIIKIIDTKQQSLIKPLLSLNSICVTAAASVVVVIAPISCVLSFSFSPNS